jgi:hypothetical protein
MPPCRLGSFLLHQRKSTRPLKQRSSNPVDDLDERGITPFGDHSFNASAFLATNETTAGQLL